MNQREDKIALQKTLVTNPPVYALRPMKPIRSAASVKNVINCRPISSILNRRQARREKTMLPQCVSWQKRLAKSK